MHLVTHPFKYKKYRLLLCLIPLLALLVTASVRAENPAQFLISEAAAKRTLHRNEISVAVAERIAKACIAHAEKNNRTAGITILSPLGYVVYAYRMDGQTRIAVDTSLRKAETVLYERTSTHAVASKYGPDMRSTLLHMGIFPFTGGLPIMLGDELIGAMGVGGMSSTEDEECAYHAITTVIGPQPALVKD